MTMSVTAYDVLELSERMRFAMRRARLNGGQMATYLGVARGTVSDWLNGRNEPKLGMLRAWAQRCGVEVAWLAEAHPGTHQAYRLAQALEVHPEWSEEPQNGALLPHLDSNQKPFDFWSGRARFALAA